LDIEIESLLGIARSLFGATRRGNGYDMTSPGIGSDTRRDPCECQMDGIARYGAPCSSQGPGARRGTPARTGPPPSPRDLRPGLGGAILWACADALAEGRPYRAMCVSPTVRAASLCAMVERPLLSAEHEDKVNEPPDGLDEDLARGRLTSQQQSLLVALTEWSADLAEIYVGACFALDDGKNPQRVFIAAYCCRELMEHLPSYLAAPSIPQDPPGLKELINDSLLPAWKALENAADEAALDRATDFFVERSRTFFSRVHGALVTRRERAALTLQAIDPSRGILPAPLQALRIRDWAEFGDYFNAILHHNKPECTVGEFRDRMAAFEHFLLSYLRPKAFEDYANIDQIIAEGELGA
jgi:hypothetical protein